MIAAFEVPGAVVALGAIVGLTYGMLAVGLVLVHRVSRLINFAHGEVGAFAAAAFGVLVADHDVPYYVALPIGLAIGAAIGGAVEVLVVRRFAGAPRLIGIVATLGVGQVLVTTSTVVNAEAGASSRYPAPPGFPSFDLGPLRVTEAHVAMLVVAPAVVAGIAVFLRRSRTGVAIRAAASNQDAARLAGISARRTAAWVWALAGGLSALTAVLVFPSRGFVTGAAFGPSLLLRALAAGVVARMTSLPRAFAAGIGLGIVEQVLLWNTSQTGLVEVLLLAVIVVALLAQRPLGGRTRETSAWAAVAAPLRLPDHLRDLPLLRHGRRALVGAVAAVLVAVPLLLDNAQTSTLTAVIAFAVVGLSVGLVTGLLGELSLGQFALAAIGATVSWAVSSRTGWFPLSFAYAGGAAAVVAVVLGLPALRAKGLLLTVTTLSFAVATPAWLLTQGWMLDAGRDPGRPLLGDEPLDTGHEYHYVALAVLLVAVVICVNVRRTGVARRFLAVRDNEDNARAFGISPTRTKLQGLALAGFVAGLGGAAYAHAFARIGAETFPVEASIDVVVMSVLGGVTSLVGPIIGVAYVIGLPAFVSLDATGVAVTKLGALLVILAAPGGINEALARVVRRVADRFPAPETTPAEDADDDDGLPATVPARAAARQPRRIAPVLLDATDLHKRYGGITAVDGVSLSVRRGETVGLIGPNGAGKTTLFELLSGFNAPDAGTVSYDGRDVTRDAPEARSRRGLLRSFQDAGLFPTLTVADSVVTALDVRHPTAFVAGIAGLSAGERRRRAEADELLDGFGLGVYRDRRIQELSTGTRRVVELACMVAQRPTLLLLDEPSAGVAQRETEALGALIDRLKADFDLTLVVIEHDIPLITSISDRVVAMDAGRVIASGPPAAVRDDPAVVASYLGADRAAIERSGTRTTRPARARKEA